MIKNLIFTSILILSSLFAYAESATFSLNGYVRDAENGEELIGATVVVKSLNKGVLSNEYGFYSLPLPEGEYEVSFLYIGYQTITKTIKLDSNRKIDIELPVAFGQLDEVVVEAHSVQSKIESTDMGVDNISMKSVELVPVLFGEKDIMKSIQLLPGVKSAGEGSSGFYVRGGSADQNLILLDEAPVYNASHLMGFFSVFNSDAIKGATLIKGAPSAEYGGRLSSVFDIKMKEGNSKKFAASGGIGLISSKLLLEAPIVKDKGSFMVSGRRTYVDLFLKASSDPKQNQSTLFFYDLNLKANYRISDKDRLFISGYMGSDQFSYADEMGIEWGNTTATVRWNHLFSEKIFSNTTLIYSDFNYSLEQLFSNQNMKMKAGIKDLSLKQDLQFYFDNSNTLKVGANLIKHTFDLGDVTMTTNDGSEPLFNSLEIDDRYAWEGAIYISDDFKPTEWLSVTTGLRYSIFNVIGEGTYKLYDLDGNITETKEYEEGETVVTYDGLEPRISFSAMLNSNSSIKAGYAKNNQYIHMVSAAATGTPFDVWYPTSPMVKPQKSDQYSIGYFRGISDGAWDLSAELYYKDMYNQVDYKNGANIFMNEDIEGDLAFGKARSYGSELMLRKNEGRLKGWVSYTLSKTDKTFSQINDGNRYPARQDRTHDISIVGMYKIDDQWDFSANWIYYTGDAVTYPSGKYVIDGETYAMYSDRNAGRMPDYHRLDFGFTYNPIPKKPRKYSSSWNFSLYNAYGRKNAFMIYFRENEDNPDVTEAVKVSLFTFIPSVTWNFKF